MVTNSAEHVAGGALPVLRVRRTLPMLHMTLNDALASSFGASFAASKNLSTVSRRKQRNRMQALPSQTTTRLKERMKPDTLPQKA